MKFVFINLLYWIEHVRPCLLHVKGIWALFGQLRGPWAILRVQICNTYVIGVHQPFYEEKNSFMHINLSKNAQKPVLGPIKAQNGHFGHPFSKIGRHHRIQRQILP